MADEAVGPPVGFRPLRPDDAQALATAFQAIGWDKSRALYERYLAEERTGSRDVIVAEVGDRVAGYVTVVHPASDPVFRRRGIPEIMDLNVLPAFRRRGIGSALLDRAEAVAARHADTVGLGVGLHGGYGTAQRLYVRRGYLPDGAGAVRDGRPVPEGDEVVLDDDLVLRMTKELAGVDPADDPARHGGSTS